MGAASSEEPDSLKIGIDAGVERETAVIVGKHVEPPDVQAVGGCPGRHKPVILIGDPVQERATDLVGKGHERVGCGHWGHQETQGA